MTQIENLLRTWNATSALANVSAFLKDNPDWNERRLYTTLKLSFIDNNRLALIDGAKGRLTVKASRVCCNGASLYR